MHTYIHTYIRTYVRSTVNEIVEVFRFKLLVSSKGLFWKNSQNLQQSNCAGVLSSLVKRLLERKFNFFVPHRIASKT